MNSQGAEERRKPTEAIGEDAVAAYLEAHPDFFEHHPDLLARLRIPHPSGHAVSLIERQVGVLRDQLRIERRRLGHLIARAKDFGALSARLHGLSLELIAARDLEQMRAVLNESLGGEFNADAVALKLFAREPDTADPDPTRGAFLEFLAREHSLCGPLDAKRSGILFGEGGEAIRSAALIPIHAKAQYGVLAIGSGDPGRFGADMGTDLLDRLGDIVGQKLRALEDTDG